MLLVSLSVSRGMWTDRMVGSFLKECLYKESQKNVCFQCFFLDFLGGGEAALAADLITG